MGDFVNTVDLLGDDAVIDGIINRSIVEFCDDQLDTLGRHAFSGCSNLTKIVLPNVTTIYPSDVNICEDCTSLATVRLDSYTGTLTLYDAAALKDVHVPLVTALPVNGFRRCYALERLDLPSCTRMGAFSLAGCKSLTALVLRNVAGVVTHSGRMDYEGETPITSGTGYIYVPKALIEDYKVATTWSEYASQFRALEDYTVDGTVTGELDETKI